MIDPTQSVFPMVKKPAKYGCVDKGAFKLDLEQSDFNLDLQSLIRDAQAHVDSQLESYIKWVCNELDITPEELGKRFYLERYYDNDLGNGNGRIAADRNSSQYHITVHYRLVPRKTDGS